MSTASQNFLFNFWGNVTIVDSSSFTINDGSGKPINVIAPGYTGLSSNDFVSACGVLDSSTTPPTLTSTPGMVRKY